LATADETRDSSLDETVESGSGDGIATTMGTGNAAARGDAVPERIGRYEIVSQLGAGGMGRVLLAADPVLGRRVALKILHADRDASDAARQRLLREAQGMAQLSHENVIVVHEVGTHDDRVYLAMEYVKGATLARWQRGRDWREILAMYTRAGRGLQAAHEAGLVHRDFKPDNVLVGDDGRVRVTDFGLVAATDATPGDDAVTAARSGELLLGEKLTVTGAIMGTPRYMAPEQHRGEPVDARADQFAFCVALHEALYGEAPFAGDDYKALVAHVLAGDVRAAPADSPVPASIRAAIVRGLARERDARHASMDELLAALAPPAPAAATPSRRGPMFAAVGAGAVVIGAIALALALRSPPRTPAPAPPAAPAAPRVVEGAASSLDIGKLQSALQAFDQASLDVAGGEYAAAAAGFEKAYAALAVPQIVYDVGVSHHLQGKRDHDAAAYARAVDAYTRYLSTDPMAPGLAEQIAVLERGNPAEIAALGEPRLRGFVLLISEPSGATVYVDDESKGPVGVTPWSGMLSGEHEILIAQRGYHLIRKRVAADPTRAMVLSAVLAKAPAP
jgi:predicted Ser/Thr protein kinase